MDGPEGGILRLAPDGASWRRNGRPWTPPRPFYAVVGAPVGHSLSPRFQGAALRAAGLAFDYLAVEAGPRELAALFERGADLGLRGWNVTTPHKAAAAALCTRLTAAAAAVAAVNAVRRRAGGWEGHNTDLGGIAASLAGPDFPVRDAVVVGAGGAGRAAALACLRAGARRVRIITRSARTAAGLRRWCGTLAATAAARIEVPPPGRPLSALGLLPGAVVVDATPPGADLAAVLTPPPAVPLGLWLALNYGRGDPGPDAATAAAGAGIDIARRLDGRRVLLEQGALAFAWWFGRAPDRVAMAAALELPR